MLQDEMRCALMIHFGNAMEQAGLGLTYCVGGMSGTRPDLALLCMENAETALANFRFVYAKWLGEACPARWKIQREVAGLSWLKSHGE